MSCYNPVWFIIFWRHGRAVLDLSARLSQSLLPAFINSSIFCLLMPPFFGRVKAIIICKRAAQMFLTDGHWEHSSLEIVKDGAWKTAYLTSFTFLQIMVRAFQKSSLIKTGCWDIWLREDFCWCCLDSGHFSTFLKTQVSYLPEDSCLRVNFKRTAFPSVNRNDYDVKKWQKNNRVIKILTEKAFLCP